MSIFSKIKEKFVGTEVYKSNSTAIFKLPPRAFRNLDFEGYCMPSSVTSIVVARMLSNSNIRLMIKFKNILKLSKFYHYIIFHTSKPLIYWKTSWIDKMAIRRSLLNHEKIHALTFPRSVAWHVIVDERFKDMFVEDWNLVRKVLLKIPTYDSMVKTGTNESAVVTAEILARVGAILHAPKKRRGSVAKYQLRNANKELLRISNDIETIWGSVEAVLAHFDLVYQGSAF